MPCLCRMNEISLLGLIWLYVFSTGLCVASLEPGYLDFDNLPDTNFSCVGKVIGGYYADLEANCQMFHVCTIGQLDEPMDIRFLCLNGTVFDQETRVCERIDEVDCSKSEKFYSLNLELYGNTQPPILEDDGDTELPPIEKSTFPSTTSTTTTTTMATTTRPRTTTRPPQFFSSSIRTVIPSPHHKLPPSHHFPIGKQHNSPHYTPQEINISLNPGAPPDIRTKSSQFPSRSYSDSVNSDNKKIVVTTDSSVYESASENANRNPLPNRLHFSSTTEQNPVNYKNHQTPEPQNNFNFNFNYHDVDTEDFSSPRPHNYHYQNNIASFRPPGLSGHSYSNSPFRSSTHRNEYLPVTRKNFEANRPTPTARSFFLQPIKSPSQQYFTRTQKPQGDDLPVPVVPTLSPIVFSSPAPFTLSRHIETKRFTDGHESPPRIIISASASVSDASGRTLNYSLGTIGAAQLLAQPPSSYDDYKEDDVVLDPFYHDVPKVQNKNKRSKRDTISRRGASTKPNRTKRTPQNINPSDIIKSEDEAIEVLKFLFDWYKNHEKTTKPSISYPVSPDEITSINKEFSRDVYNTEDYSEDTTLERATQSHTGHLQNSDLFNSNSKFNILGDVFGPSRGSVLQDPVKQSYTSSGNENVISDIFGRPSTNYKDSYEVTKTPEITELYDQKQVEYEYHSNNRASPSTNRKKPFRGRHRFTVPYSSTERQVTNNYDENLYIQPNLTPSAQHVYNGDLSHDIENSYTTSPTKRYQNSFEPNKWHSHSASKEKLRVSYTNTESSFTNTFEEPLPESTHQEIENHGTQKYIESSALEESTENYDNRVSTTPTKQKETITEIFGKVSTETSAHWNISDESRILSNSTTSINTPVELANKTSLSSNSEDNFFESHEQDFTLEELNRAESQKTTKQLQQTSTQNYGHFDMYDYVNDNYEPSTYVEDPEKLIEQQLEKNRKEFGKEIVHEETRINVDFTEPSYDTSSEEHTTSTSDKESGKVRQSLKSDKETIPNKDTKSDQIDDTTPTFKYIDKNINSFTDILKSLRDFQRYEQNIYNYNHNLIGLKEYDHQKDDLDEELKTTTLPTTLETNTNESQFFDDFSNETVDQHDDEGLKFNSSYSFKNLHRVNYTVDKNEGQYSDSTKFVSSISQTEKDYIFSTQMPENEHLYTSKPFENANGVNYQSTTDLDHSESTLTLSHLETTISNVNEETLFPSESTTIKNDTDGFTTHIVTTLRPHFTQQTDLRSRSKTKSRVRHKSRENSRRRTQNQPFADNNLGKFHNFNEHRWKNRRRQPNSPHTPINIRTTSSEAPFTTISRDVASSFEKIKHFSIDTLNLPLTEIETLEEERNSNPTTNATEETTSQTVENPSDRLANSTVGDDASNGFFITRIPNYGKNEGVSVITNQAENFPTDFITEEPTEDYTNNLRVEEETLETTMRLISTTIATPTDYEFLNNTTENTQLTDHTEAITSDYPSNIHEESTASFTENELPNTTSNSLDILSSADNNSTAFTNLVQITSQDTTTSKDLETLFTDSDTNTDASTQLNHEIIGNNPTEINVLPTTKYDSETSLIKEIEAATNSTVINEIIQVISAEDDISTNTTEMSRNGYDVDLGTESSIEAKYPPTTTESLYTSDTKINTVSSNGVDYQTTPEIHSTLLITTTKQIEEITKSTLENTTSLPITRVEIITQINTDTITATPDETTAKINSQYTYDNIESLNNNERTETQTKIEKFNGHRAQQRLPKKKSPGNRRFNSRHRFSTDNIKPKTASSSKSFRNKHKFWEGQASHSPVHTIEQKELEKLSQNIAEVAMTDDPLPKNVKPTQGETSPSNLSTTPITTLYKVQLRKERVNKQFIFNCFGKTLDTFYSDPRDCRLFHYCTKGYTRNQLLDMKFVCDFGTHFDDEKLVCTTEVPKRCL